MAVYKLKLRQGDKEIEVEGEEKFIDQMLKRFGFTETPTSKSKTPTTEEIVTINKTGSNISTVEFVLKNQFKKHTDIVLAFGYYLENFRGMSKFTPGDINNCYYESKMDASNTSQMISQNVKKGFLMEAKGSGKTAAGKKYYTLTQSGLQYIEKHFTTK